MLWILCIEVAGSHPPKLQSSFMQQLTLQNFCESKNSTYMRTAIGPATWEVWDILLELKWQQQEQKHQELNLNIHTKKNEKAPWL